MSDRVRELVERDFQTADLADDKGICDMAERCVRAALEECADMFWTHGDTNAARMVETHFGLKP